MDEALVAAAEMNDSFTDRFQPEKSIDLVDEACSQLRFEQEFQTGGLLKSRERFNDQADWEEEDDKESIKRRLSWAFWTFHRGTDKTAFYLALASHVNVTIMKAEVQNPPRPRIKNKMLMKGHVIGKGTDTGMSQRMLQCVQWQQFVFQDIAIPVWDPLDDDELERVGSVDQ
jgi:ATP-dependent Clp protease ATP-binding subunit ClpA